MKKGSKKVKNILILDTETTNDISQPLPYDVGYAITDIETGRTLLTRSFVVAEIFFDKQLMESAYFADKIPQYFEDIRTGKKEVRRICTIRRIIKQDMKKYNVSKVGAYNMGFDKRATNNDTRYITGSMVRWFFPYGTEFFDIWSAACSSILHTKDFVNFAKEHDYVSEKGNIRTSAEVCYKYITNNTDFEEDHTGLEDVMIETAIYLAILNSGLDFTEEIHGGCWRWVQKVGAE